MNTASDPDPPPTGATANTPVPCPVCRGQLPLVNADECLACDGTGKVTAYERWFFELEPGPDPNEGCYNTDLGGCYL